MFGQLGQMAGMMKNLPKLQKQMEEYQQRINSLTAEGNAGAGMVTVKVNGKMEVLSCRITDEALKLNDREMLEDLIVAATNQAMSKVRQVLAEEMSKMTSGLGLPPGMNIPGLS
ncbi:YbaB/EbfC family nucleoid-associated protein [Telmatocola sphagniphila]|jgi:DNA-binding YbaB/EbfC family protein|uniref:Nucleoid-associated protein KIH39_11415 n=1 Tax=Telmatocola sphagniphila TaxID=1123043 RepID=A0A8E6BAL5_9BACT|nr:YbaB/EbfC family nucleoid-associated protein [Telmatocola sphagniphila]QVL34484.1 YbaB/EbfC family nucleoid-associated protein [Telmatocola sphagniphila]